MLNILIFPALFWKVVGGKIKSKYNTTQMPWAVKVRHRNSSYKFER